MCLLLMYSLNLWTETCDKDLVRQAQGRGGCKGLPPPTPNPQSTDLLNIKSEARI